MKMTENALYPLPTVHPHSPSCSPERKFQFFPDKLDPLLASLSPESTIEALTAINAVPRGEKQAHDILTRSISRVSTEERALGIRAAVAALRLREWYKEVQGWPWPKGNDVRLGKGFITPFSLVWSRQSDSKTYLGSLPIELVGKYETRVEEIRGDMDGLGIEELKEHVLNAHIPSRSRPSSSNSTISIPPPPLTHVQLSDFTTVITATTLRALPTMSRLSVYLEIWDVRLLVLRQTPGLLTALETTGASIDAALSSLGDGDLPIEDHPLFSMDTFRRKREELERMVLSTGRRMDRILDMLEGRDDSIPEVWIDNMEAIESNFGTWVVEAEKRVAENEWKRYKEQQAQEKVMMAPVSELDGNIPEKDATGIPDVSTLRERPRESVIADQARHKKAAVTLSCQEITIDSGTRPVSSSRNGIFEDASDGFHASRKSSPKSFISTTNVVSTGSSSLLNAKEAVSLYKPDHEANDPVLVTSPSISSEDQIKEPLADLQQYPLDLMPESTLCLTRDQRVESSTMVYQISPIFADDEKENANPTEAFSQQVGRIISSIPSENLSSVREQVANDTMCPMKLGEPGPNAFQSKPVEIIAIPSQFSLESSRTSGNSIQHDIKQIDHPQDLNIDVNEVHKRQLETPVNVTKPSVYSPPKESFLPMTPFSTPDLAPMKRSKIQETSPTPTQGSPSIRILTPEQLNQASPALASTDSDRTLRDGLSPKPKRRSLPTHRSFERTRAASLPLQRFINESIGTNHDMEGNLQRGVYETREDTPDEAAEGLPKGKIKITRLERDENSSPPLNIKPRPSQRQLPSSPTKSLFSAMSIDDSPPWQGSPHAFQTGSFRNTLEMETDYSREPPFGTGDSPQFSMQLSDHTLNRLMQQNTNSLNSRDSGDEAPRVKENIHPGRGRSSTGATVFKDTDDQFEEKINSILTTIPARIRLKSAMTHDIEVASVSSSVSASKNDGLHSKSPCSTPSRCSTPTPSLTLTPAFSRSRHPRHGGEEKTVRVYHLHRGEKTAPTKLFVRSVGEDGERVMVRVGGGWADLGEYLREYALHHGRRTTSNGRVEVQGLPAQGSPSSSPGSTITPTRDHERNTPLSRPGSVLSTRPPSSLALRKIRRTSGPSLDLPNLTAANIQKATGHLSPTFHAFSHRRLSVSSSNSASVASTAGDVSSHYSSSTRAPTPNVHATPLGLAGPKPRSRRVSMSPESEAWVEDVIGQARKTSSSLKPPKHVESRTEREHGGVSTLKNSKTRSVSDIGTANLNKRVLLRGLSTRKDQEKDATSTS